MLLQPKVLHGFAAGCCGSVQSVSRDRSGGGTHSKIPTVVFQDSLRKPAHNERQGA